MSTPSWYLQSYQPYPSLLCRVNAGTWEVFTPSTTLPLFVLLLHFCSECLQVKKHFPPPVIHWEEKHHSEELISVEWVLIYYGVLNLYI